MTSFGSQLWWKSELHVIEFSYFKLENPFNQLIRGQRFALKSKTPARFEPTNYLSSVKNITIPLQSLLWLGDTKPAYSLLSLNSAHLKKSNRKQEARIRWLVAEPSMGDRGTSRFRNKDLLIPDIERTTMDFPICFLKQWVLNNLSDKHLEMSIPYEAHRRFFYTAQFFCFINSRRKKKEHCSRFSYLFSWLTQ